MAVNVQEYHCIIGAWVCLNNVDCLQSGVMSTLSELLHQVLVVLAGRLSTITLFNEELHVNPTGIFLTTVDATNTVKMTRSLRLPQVYSATSHVPRSLAHQFRCVGVKAPPLQVVTELLLHSNGILLFAYIYFG